MHPKLRFYTYLAVTILWIAATSLPLSASRAEPPSPQDSQAVAISGNPDIRGFHLVSPEEGWLWLGEALYWTPDGGSSWREITPSAAAMASLQAVTFLDSRSGWAALVSEDGEGDPVYQLARTRDGGSTWQAISLTLFEPNDVAALAGAVYLDFIDPQTGWLVVKQATGSSFDQGTLFKTVDGGLTWTRQSAPAGDPVYFMNSEIGWMVGGPANNVLYRTTDSGLTWAPQSLPGVTGGNSLYLLPDFKDAGQGILPVIVRASSGAHVEFYAAHNNGETWEPAASTPLDRSFTPGTNPPLSLLDGSNWVLIDPAQSEVLQSVNNLQTLSASSPASLQGGIIDLNMATSNVGWARYADGNCQTLSGTTGSLDEEISCTSRSGLLKTADGGQTWSILALPQAAQAMAAASILQVVTGHGFDSCINPNVSTMQAWMDRSPYRFWNLYIGGSSYASVCDQLTGSYIMALISQGWRFNPTWVGPQAPCFGGKSVMSSDPTEAFYQGVNEANLATNAAANLLLTQPDKSGTVIYYDLEAYSITNSTCRTATQYFISGWTLGLHDRGNKAGLYASRAAMQYYVDIAGVPDSIWPAYWVTPYQFRSDATVWDIPGIDNTWWDDHQRLRQYTGGHNETWGGLTINVDCSVADGLALDLGGGPVARITSPADNTWLPKTPILVTVAPIDPGTIISKVDFEWHSGDWQGASWVPIGSDTNGSDGWTIPFDPSNLVDQAGAAIFAYVYDSSGNRSGAGVWNLGVDRTGPKINGISFAPMYTDSPFRDFQVYINGTDISGIASYDLQYSETQGGPWVDTGAKFFDTNRFVGEFGHTYYFRARGHDILGYVGDYSTGADFYKEPDAACTLPPDQFEPDNTSETARLIPANGTIKETHSFHAERDEDWFKFVATGRTPYSIVTANTGTHSDTVIYLYGLDGKTLITLNDDYPGLGLGSRVDWEAVAAGTYYFKVVHYDIYAAGCTTSYELTITQTNNYRMWFPLVGN